MICRLLSKKLKKGAAPLQPPHPKNYNTLFYFLDIFAESFLKESRTACIELPPSEPPDLLPCAFCAATLTVSVLVESITVVVLVLEFESITVVDVESGPLLLPLCFGSQAASDKTIAATRAELIMFFIMLFLLGVYKL